ncbi:MAG: hypothetical protein U9R37_02485 [Campylobacterota bacterium]|nr:hypothetical protein [Campylobacterota bacterium]
METGEIIETDTEQLINYGRTQDFVMSFTKDLGYMKNLSKGEIMVMFGFLQIVNNDNEVVLNQTIKKRICKEYEIKLSSIDSLISGLKKKEMIFQKDRGVYQLNTFLFGKGSWANIKKQRMFIEWDFKSLTKKVMVEQELLTEEEILEKQIIQQQEQLELMKQKKEEEKKRDMGLFDLKNQDS